MIKTFMGMLLSGAMGAGGALGFQQFNPPQPPDLSLLHTDLVALQSQIKQTDAALLNAVSNQNVTLTEMHSIMERAEADRLEARAQAQAMSNKRHAEFNQIIQSMPR
jgi:hypothetical protein